MAKINDDILDLDAKQKNFKATKGKYVQALRTPEIIPMEDSVTTFTKLRKPHDETDEIDFTPKAKNYSFKVDVWTRKHEGVETDGYKITAERDLGEGIVETVTKSSGDDM